MGRESALLLLAQRRGLLKPGDAFSDLPELVMLCGVTEFWGRSDLPNFETDSI